MPHKGKLATWNDDKGFGFIEPNDGGPRVFVHIKAFKSRSRRPIQGDVVSYETAKDNQGRTNAVNATLGGGKAKRRSGPKGRALANEGSDAATHRPGWRMAWCVNRPGVAASQVEEDVVSGRICDFRGLEWRRPGLASYGRWAGLS
jgi:cold shock CspA family protein